MTNGRRFGVLVVFLPTVVAGLFFLTKPRGTIMRPETQQLADSVDRTAPHHDSATAALARVDSQLLRRSAQIAAAAKASLARAGVEKHRADSLAEVARTTTASADDWRLAHDARLAETQELRATIDTMGARIATLETAGDSLRRANALERERLDAVARLNAGLRADIAKADCAIITWPKRVRCPTRTETALGVLGAREAISLANRLVVRRRR